MKKITLFSLIAAAALMLSSCIHLGDLNLEPVPSISFEYETDGMTLTFTKTSENTSNVTWEIIGETTGSGDTFSYTFSKPGVYWVVMSADYQGEHQSFSGKILVSKPSPVKLDDDSFDDWDLVTDPDFQLQVAIDEDNYPGYENRGYAKFDYDANYIYFFFALNADLPNAGPGEAIINIRLDSDDLTGTGMSTKSLGCDWYLEGAIWGEESWYCNYDCSTGDTVESDMPLEIGTCKVEDGLMKMEFAYSRKLYKINGSSIGVFCKFYHSDWDNAMYVRSPEGKDTFHLSLDKMN